MRGEILSFAEGKTAAEGVARAAAAADRRRSADIQTPFSRIALLST